MKKQRLLLLPERFTDDMAVQSDPPRRKRLILANLQPEIAPRRRLILGAVPEPAPRVRAILPAPTPKRRLMVERKRLLTPKPNLSCVVATSNYFADLGKLPDKAVFEVASAQGFFGSREKQQRDLCNFILQAREDVVEQVFTALSVAAIRQGQRDCVRLKCNGTHAQPAQ